MEPDGIGNGSGGGEVTYNQNGSINTEKSPGYYVATINEDVAQLLEELQKERDILDPKHNPHLYRLIQKEIARVVTADGAGYSQDVDLYYDTPITLNVKCFPPTTVYPNFNYAGRILGPKGTYLRALMKETKAKMKVLGHGVMKDKVKEAELKRGNDPRYMHLREDMHISITVTAPGSEAYERMSYAMACLKRQTLSDNREMQTLPWLAALNTAQPEHAGGAPPPAAYHPAPLAHPPTHPPVHPPAHPPVHPRPAEVDYGHALPPPPKRRPMPPPPGYADYYEAAGYQPPPSMPPRQPPQPHYYEEYVRVPRPVPQEYRRPPPPQVVASTAEKLRESADRAAALQYSRSKAQAATVTYDYDHTAYAPGEGPPPAIPSPGQGVRMRPPAPASNRYFPYPKY